MIDHNKPVRKSWKQWRLPRPLGVALFLPYLALLVIYTHLYTSGAYGLGPEYHDLGVVGIVLGILLLLCLDRLEYWHKRPAAPPEPSAIFRLFHTLLVLALVFHTGIGVIGYGTLPSPYLVKHPWLAVTILLFVGLLLIGEARLSACYADPELGRLVPAVIQTLRLAFILCISFSAIPGALDETVLLLIVPFGLFSLVGRSFWLSGPVWILYLAGRAAHNNLLLHKGRLPGENDPSSLIIYILALALIYAILIIVKRERTNRMQAEKLLSELEESHRKLQTYAEQVAELATMEERNRLARDIHDSLGHYLTVINVQLEKALVFRNRNPAEADESVRESKRMAGEALQEVRHSVSALRSPAGPFSLDAALRELVANINAAGPVAINLEILGSESGYPRMALTTLYRAAQEGLTNVQKHAQASQVNVRMQLGAEEATLLIEDNGCGFATGALAASSGHYGLQGVKERLAVILGSLKLESEPGRGTRLTIHVPKHPTARIGKN